MYLGWAGLKNRASVAILKPRAFLVLQYEKISKPKKKQTLIGHSLLVKRISVDFKSIPLKSEFLLLVDKHWLSTYVVVNLITENITEIMIDLGLCIVLRYVEQVFGYSCQTYERLYVVLMQISVLFYLKVFLLIL